MYHIRFILAFSLARYESMVKYGPPVQGRRNKLINIPTKNAPEGEVIFLIYSLDFILRDSGISIVKNFQNQK